MSASRGRLRALATGLGCATIAASAALLAPTLARAEFAPATLLSGTTLFSGLSLQFEGANVPALSADGRYAVFQGSIAGVPGIYRRDLETEATELVAGGAAKDPEARCEVDQAHPFVACDATAPSVSADGRYVAFTTTADLQPQESLPGGEVRGEPPADVGCPEVYVRDMDREPGEPGAYTLAAALNGSQAGISFASCAPPRFAGFALLGAQAAPAVALSADGRRVAFTVLGESNLDGPATSPGQVAVRDLDTDTTTLLTTDANGGPVAGGGAFPDTFSLANSAGATAWIGNQNSYGDQAAGSTAAISADGSTVAWLGMNVAEQVSEAEAEREPQVVKGTDSEAEPLWRRVGGGSARRLLTGAGLGFFAGPDPAESPEPVETGSLRGTRRMDFVAPALSADGDSVAVIATAPPAAAQLSLQEGPTGESEFSSDAYLVQIGDDPNVAPRVSALTEINSYAVPESQLGDVKDVAISPDGTRVAFDVSRSPLYLPSLAMIGPEGEENVYEANLTRGTLEPVAITYDGAKLNGAVGLVCFDGDGQTLAFASVATDLVFGDAFGGWQVYAARDLSASYPRSAQLIGATPILLPPAPEWALEATATPAADGTVLVKAQVPGAGRLTVSAGAQLAEHPATGSSSTRRLRIRRQKRARVRVARSSANTKQARRRRTRKAGSSPIPARTVARGAMLAAGPAELDLRLRVGAPYRRLIASRDGLYAVLRVAFAAPGHPTLIREVPVTFHLRARGPATQKRTTEGPGGHPERAR